MNYIEINKFSKLHNAKNIIFCKTDFLFEEFEFIKKLEDEVILITGNSDYPITDYHINLAPKNIKKWFAQNALSNSEILEPLPLGLENKIVSFREGHGIGYFDRVLKKEELLNRNLKINPGKKIYANFKTSTNVTYRSLISNICNSSKHIDYEEPNLTLEQFFDKILDYEIIVCPIGNGIDTHRLWEVLYSNRIPLTIKTGEFKIYELYNKLPIIILEKIEDLNNEDLINKKLNLVKNNVYNLNLLNYNYWEEKILSLL